MNSSRLLLAALMLASISLDLRAAAPKPTLSDVKYGPHERNVLDFYQAKSDAPTPLLIYIHGGGFAVGDKNAGAGFAEAALNAGISFVSINYRFSQHAIYPAPMQDGARALQFCRSKAKEWNIDPKKVAAAGASAGGGIALWLAFRDDMADPKNADPIARESTRLSCAYVVNAQSSYDPRFIKQHIKGDAYKCNELLQLFGIKAPEADTPTPQKAKLFEDASPINFIDANDPPVYFIYTYRNEMPEDPGITHGIHHPKFGLLVKEKLEKFKTECIVYWEGHYKGPQWIVFVSKHLSK